jgi:hypothetical protein
MFRFLMNLIRRQPRVSRAHINAVLATTNVDRIIERALLAAIIAVPAVFVATHVRADTKSVTRNDVTITTTTRPYRPTVDTIHVRRAPRDVAPPNDCPTPAFEIVSRGRACVENLK